MKLIIAGSTSFIATELLRQALSNKSITTVLALARRTTPVPENLPSTAQTSKLRSVICEDFENWSDDVKKELEGADACVWCLGLSISKFRALPFPEVVKITRDYTVSGIKQISKLPLTSTSTQKPFRFIYISGYNIKRDVDQPRPWLYPDFVLMRGETERLVLSTTAEADPAIQACIFGPGLIGSFQTPGFVTKIFQGVGSVIGVPVLKRDVMGAALLRKVLGGWEAGDDTVEHGEIVRIGTLALEAE